MSDWLLFQVSHAVFEYKSKNLKIYSQDIVFQRWIGATHSSLAVTENSFVYLHSHTYPWKGEGNLRNQHWIIQADLLAEIIWFSNFSQHLKTSVPVFWGFFSVATFALILIFAPISEIPVINSLQSIFFNILSYFIFFNQINSQAWFSLKIWIFFSLHSLQSTRGYHRDVIFDKNAHLFIADSSRCLSSALNLTFIYISGLCKRVFLCMRLCWNKLN